MWPVFQAFLAVISTVARSRYSGHDAILSIARSRAIGRAHAGSGRGESVNRRYGRDSLRPGGTGQRPDWSMRQAKLWPVYTTRFEELLPVSA